MALPFHKELRVAELELSNAEFASTIDYDLSRNNARQLLLDRFVYPSDAFLAEISCRVYKEQKKCTSLLEQCWVLLTTAKNSNDGYFGAAYWNPDQKQVVIAHKGTRLTSCQDIWADFEGVLSNEYTSQMSSAATFSNNIARELYKLSKKHSTMLTISITGHSLGGWLAQITAFSMQYLTTKSFDDEGYFFVKSKKEGYHTHIVVFDSPGCKDMLLKMESDFNVRYNGKSHLCFLLDVTIYLSAPNVVNTLHSHLNVGNLYRVFIEGLPTRKSCFDFFQYTRQTHKKEKIRDVFFCKETSLEERIMKVIDWPLVKGGLWEKIIAKFSTDLNEYDHFHYMANCTNYYNPNPDDAEYCILRYQVQNVRKGECSANVFTQSEFEFLDCCQRLKQVSMLSVADDLFSLIDQKTKGAINKDKVEEILQNFDIKNGEGLGIIKCCSEEKLQKIIICVKNVLFLFPTAYIEIKSKLENLDVYNDAYEKQSLEYLQSIDFIALKKPIPVNIVDFLNNANSQFLLLTCQFHPIIGIRKIQMTLKKAKSNYKSFFLSLEQLVSLQQLFPLRIRKTIG